MGKGRSPGKWIKNLLLGKKSLSKSKSSKKSDSFKLSSNKDVTGSSEDSLVISAPITSADATNGVLSAKNGSSNDRGIPSARDEEACAQAVGDFRSQEDRENLKVTEAAITVQASCRGYQARQTFQMLKGGIIQLQALIRGHLVRRQAVSALYCIKGIVKIQALARGYIVRHSDIGLSVQKIRKDTQCSNSTQVVTSTHAEKLSESVFVQKLLVSSSSVVPQSLNCDPTEPNLAWKWLDRWTVSHFWKPLQELKKKSVSDEKTGSSQTVKRKQVKRTTQKSPTVKADDGSNSGSNKHKQRPKKDSHSPSLSAQEHPQKDIEKNSVKKTRLQSVSDKSELVTEKRKFSTKKSSDHAVTNVSEQGLSASSEKMKDLAVSKSDPEKSLGHQEEEKHDNELKSLKKPSVQNVAVRTEGVGEKRKHSTREISDHAVTDVSEQGASASSDIRKDLVVLESKESDPDKGIGHEEDKHDNEPKSPKACFQNVEDRSEVVSEKENHSAEEISDHTATDVSEQCTSDSLEKKKDLVVSNGKESDAEKSLGQQEDTHNNESKSPKRTNLQNVANRSELFNENRKHSTRKSSDHTVTDVSDQGRHASSEKKKDLAVSTAKESDPERSFGHQEENHDNGPNCPKKPALQKFADKSEVANGKRKHSAGKISDHTATSESGPNSSSEKKKVLTASKSKESDPKKSVGQQAEDKQDYEAHVDPIPVLQTSLTNGGNEGNQRVNDDLNGGDSSISNNYHRRASLPANFNDQDNESHSTPRLPSYMAPTESAKAKLRAQGSPRLTTDFADKNSVARRHSLSSSFNGKSGSFSPRAERLVAMSSRGVLRNDRSLSSSRDATDKLIQPQWRR